MTKNEVARLKRFVSTYKHHRIGAGYFYLYPDKARPDEDRTLAFVMASEFRRKNETYIDLKTFYVRVIAKYGVDFFRTHVRNIRMWTCEVYANNNSGPAVYF